MAEYNTMGKQRGSKNRCVIHGIRDDTLRWKGNTYLVILVSWILGILNTGVMEDCPSFCKGTVIKRNFDGMSSLPTS